MISSISKIVHSIIFKSGCFFFHFNRSLWFAIPPFATAFGSSFHFDSIQFAFCLFETRHLICLFVLILNNFWVQARFSLSSGCRWWNATAVLHFVFEIYAMNKLNVQCTLHSINAWFTYSLLLVFGIYWQYSMALQNNTSHW